MTIEVCCSSYRDALASFKGGADRVELCSSLFFGGLTPSIGTLSLVKENTSLETACMLRPREGGFCYNDDEFSLMLKDAEYFIKCGADALVFGFLTENGEIDYEKTARMVSFVKDRCQCVFHKAFDVSKTPLIEAHRLLKEAGIDRILTSGREQTALLGCDNIKTLIDLGGIEIMPGGGVRSHNITEIFQKTGCRSVHTSAFTDAFDGSADSNKVSFVGTAIPFSGQYSLSNAEIIRKITDTGRSLI